MRVSLIGKSCYSENNFGQDHVIFTALSQCYNEHFDLEDLKKVPSDKINNIIKSVLNSGHDSVSEHVSFTFLVEDVSRVLTHQLVRHRIASYSQRSARYTKINTGEDWYVIPKSIRTTEQLEVFDTIMEQEAEAYNKLIELGVPKEDARFVVGDGQSSNIVVTMNCRALKNFFGERLCTRAQWEIRELANKMATICKKELPIVFDTCKFAEPACVQKGFCTEHKSCGKMPHISKVKDLLK